MTLSHSVTIRPIAVDPTTAAALLGRAPKTLANWRSEGTGPRYVKDGASILYRMVDLESWLEAHAVEPEKLAS